MQNVGTAEHGYGIRRQVPGDLSPSALIGDAVDRIRTNPLETIGGFIGVLGVTYGVQFVFTIAIYVLLIGGVFAFAAVGEVIGQDAAGVLAIMGGSFAYFVMIATMVILQTLAMALYQMYWLKLSRGQTQSINYLRVLKVTAAPLSLAALLVTMATMAGLLAFVIGAYVVMLGLMFTSTIIWDYRVGAVEAMKRSWELTSGYKLQLFVVFLAIVALNLVGAMMCGLGLLVTAPVSAGAIAMFYDRIAQPGNAYLRV